MTTQTLSLCEDEVFDQIVPDQVRSEIGALASQNDFRSSPLLFPTWPARLDIATVTRTSGDCHQHRLVSLLSFYKDNKNKSK